MKRSIISLKPCLSLSNGVMSRKRIPGIGKSGIARIRRSVSTGNRDSSNTDSRLFVRSDMRHRILAAALTAALAVGTYAPALADGAASTRNIILLGTATGLLVTNYNHKVRAK